jgi:tetratricopeptide (TPR) repeat protein
MWEMTVVSIVGMALLGLLTARASLAAPGPPRVLPVRFDLTARATLVLVGLAVIAAQAVSLLTNRELQASQAAVARGDVSAAFKHANRARRIEPWASSPYTQLALVAEEGDDYAQAQAWIEKAIARDRSDWSPWYLSARFQTERGHVRSAATALCRSYRLNPRSDLFATRPCR